MKLLGTLCGIYSLCSFMDVLRLLKRQPSDKPKVNNSLLEDWIISNNILITKKSLLAGICFFRCTNTAKQIRGWYIKQQLCPKTIRHSHFWIAYCIFLGLLLSSLNPFRNIYIEVFEEPNIGCVFSLLISSFIDFF